MKHPIIISSNGEIKQKPSRIRFTRQQVLDAAAKADRRARIVAEAKKAMAAGNYIS